MAICVINIDGVSLSATGGVTIEYTVVCPEYQAQQQGTVDDIDMSLPASQIKAAVRESARNLLVSLGHPLHPTNDFVIFAGPV